METQDDGVDLSQLKTYILSSQVEALDPVAFAGDVQEENKNLKQNTSTSSRDTAATNNDNAQESDEHDEFPRSEATRLRLTLSQPQLPSTIPESPKARMAALSSQSQGDTQPVSQWALDEFTSKSRRLQAAKQLGSWGRSTDDDSTAHTYLPGQTGHVNLLGAFEDPSPSAGQTSNHDDVEDELATLSQIQDVRVEPYPESKRFRQPKTPASINNKRKRDADTTPQDTTPTLPINPFAGQPDGIEGLMNASQVFRATQAPSSPSPTALPSDPLSGRPSPNLYDIQRPSTSDASSSPVKRPATAMTRSITEPQTIYISMKESQAERERKRLKLAEENARVSAESSDDGFDSEDSIVRRQKQRKMQNESRARFSEITAKSRPTTPSRGRGRGRGRGRVEGSLVGHEEIRNRQLTTTPRTSKIEPVLISDDPSPRDSHIASDAETSCEEDPIQVLGSQAESSGSANKENVPFSSVQVPGTTSKLRLREGQARVQQSPSTRGKQFDVTSEEVCLPGTASTDKTEEILRGTPAFDVADSQPSKKEGATLQPPTSLSDPSLEPASSPGSRFIVPQSQLAPSCTTTSEHNQTGQEGVVEQNVTISSANAESPEEITQVRIPPSVGEAPLSHPKRKAVQIESVVRSGKRIKLSQQGLVGSQKSNSTQTMEGSAATEVPRSEDAAAVVQQDGAHPDCLNRQNTSASVTIPESSAGEDSAQSMVDVETIHGRASTSIDKNSGQSHNGDISSKSTVFDTAQSHLGTAADKVHCSPKGPQTQSTDESPIRHSSRLRTMTEIATQPTPSDAIGSIDVDIDLMTSDDIEFHSIVTGSSPPIPDRKRRRGLDGRAIRVKNHDIPLATSSPLTTPPSSHAGEADHPAFTSEATKTLISVASLPGKLTSSKSPNVEKQTSNPCASTDSQPVKAPVQSRKKPKSVPNLLPPSNDIASDTGNTTAVGNDDEASHGDPTEAHDLVRDAASERSDAIIAPARVFAYFNGNCAGFYPATCIGVVHAEEPWYRVRFDDGTVDTISAFSVKRLELRQGDAVKVDVIGFRKKAYIVEGLQGQLQSPILADPETPSRKRNGQQSDTLQYPPTDIYGHDKVALSLKQGQPAADENGQHIVVPLEQIYLTSSMWQYYKQREFTYTNGQAAAACILPTPSDRPSTPATPSSRTRRAKFLGPSGMRAAMSTGDLDAGLFPNMVFAISNVATESKRNRTTQLIQEQGGKVLVQGFDELFDIPKLAMAGPGIPNLNEQQFRLTAEANAFGFTCLLADKHSRSIKYIQALALGIPCLSTRWIQDCVSKQRLLPWDTYLLAAGESMILDGAVRSRQLQYYPAENARLSTIVGNRAKLLNGMSVLLIMTKSEEKDMQNHPLLTYALGAARVCRAASIEAAAGAIAEAQNSGEHWDWVYSHENEREAEKALYGDYSTGKKRKRGRVSEAVGLAGKSRIVGHEFVIQSLILGRLVEAD
ncbi:MAG: hypothetical protein Q9212_006251 [Teloschistes hypoglaucus]